MFWCCLLTKQHYIHKLWKQNANWTFPMLLQIRICFWAVKQESHSAQSRVSQNTYAFLKTTRKWISPKFKWEIDQFMSCHAQSRKPLTTEQITHVVTVQSRVSRTARRGRRWQKRKPSTTVQLYLSLLPYRSACYLNFTLYGLLRKACVLAWDKVSLPWTATIQ